MRAKSRLLTLLVVLSTTGAIACSALLGFDDLRAGGDGGPTASNDDGGDGAVVIGDGGDGGDGGVVAAGKPVGVIAVAPPCAVSTYATTADNPHELAIDPTGNLYVATGNAIARIAVGGGSLMRFGASTEPGMVDGDAIVARFSGPRGLAVSADGSTLFVADVGNHRIRQIALATGLTTTFSGSDSAASDGGPVATATYNAPTFLALDDAGMYVGDNGDLAVRTIAGGIVDPPGHPPVNVGALRGLAASSTPSERFFFSNQNEVVTLGVTKLVVGSVTAGSNDSPNALFFQPAQLVVEAERIYVADLANNRIRCIRPSSVEDVRTLAGPMDGGTASGTGNGSCALARFSGPAGLCADAVGDLYVSDVQSSQIRKITGVDGQLVVGWHPPADGTASTVYVATATPELGGDSVTASCTAIGVPTCTIGRLTSGVMYTVVVQSIGSGVAGPASDPSAAVATH